MCHNKRLYLFFALFSFFFMGEAFASPPREIIFFGDSLTDNGNLYRLDLHFLPKSPPYFEGRFSNGPTWAEIVGEDYAKRRGTAHSIYAWGGATAISYNPFTHAQLAYPITLTTEVDRYIFDSLFHQGFNRSNTLFSIWIGGNDYLYSYTNDAIETATGYVIDEIERSIRRLIAYHADKFLVLNLPDLGKTPFAKQPGHDGKRLHALTVSHNEKLAAIVDKLKKEFPEITFIFIDVGFFFDDLIRDPEPYNKKRQVHIRDTTHACWPGSYFMQPLPSKEYPEKLSPEETLLLTSPALQEAWSTARKASANMTACTNPDDYVFWDSIHPTHVAHTMIAARVLDQLREAGLD